MSEYHSRMTRCDLLADLRLLRIHTQLTALHGFDWYPRMDLHHLEEKPPEVLLLKIQR